MSRNPLNLKLLSSMLMAGALVFTGCNDKDYDFNEIDATVGIGGDGLEIPASTTENIKLKDVLDLEEDGSVVEDATTHDYVFRRTGDPINPIVVNINKITVAKSHGQSLPFTFSTASNAKGGPKRAYGTIHADADIYEFTYNGEKPKEVVDLTHAGATTKLNLSVPLPAISGAVSTLDNITISLPGYIEYTVGNCSKAPKSNSNNTLVFENVPTNGNFEVEVNVTGLNFKYSGTKANSIAVSKDKISLVGTIHLKANGSITSLQASLPTVQAQFNMADFTINSATGKFDPEINMNDGLGKTSITGIPEFLQDENVKVDLYNPHILLTVGNDMNAEGTITGKIVSKKNGAVINTIEGISIPIVANSTNKICINRRSDEVMDGYTMVHVPELSKAIETIPDEIVFEATAKANSNKEIEFLLGHDYHITPAYSIDAPLAFAENAEIVYKDTLDGWNDDIDDLELAEGTYLSATANVENGVPAYLSVDAIPVGVAKADGTRNVIEGIKIEFPDGKNKVTASTDGVTKTESPLEIKITETAAGSLKKLDGIIFTASGKAKEGDNTVTGVTLNADKHTLHVKDIKIKVVGKVIGDFN